ncbi:hypothetical protein [Lentzea sp. NPDC055074]
MYRNEINGSVYGLSVQAGQIIITSGSEVTDSPAPLAKALNKATVVVRSPTGVGRGVRVGRSLVLTLSSLAPQAPRIPGHPDLALVECAANDEIFACIRPAEPIEAFRTVLERVPGAPVLNRLTGEVCALVTGPNSVTSVPDLPLDPDQGWLDLLQLEQLAESGRQHLTPVLRKYLHAVRLLGQHHEYERAETVAPDLHKIYLERWAKKDADEDETELLETIDADELLTTHPNSQIVAEPGLGKSSLIRHFAAQTADALLTGRGSTVVPVPITADAFRGKLLPEALAGGVLAEPDLTRQELVGLFRDEPLADVRWHILVDGLDEVIDPQLRANVLRQIRQIRQNPKYVVTLTSRQLTPVDVKRFHDRGHPTYVLKPFRDEDLKRFVSAWLAQEGRPADEAAQLVVRLRRTKLEELIFVPLIATMVCDLYCAAPDADLPRDQTELYRRFVEWQLSKVSQHDLGARLRQWQARTGYSAEQTAAEIRDKLEPLLREIAYGLLTIAPEPTVLDIAVSRHTGADRGALDEALRMSGLVVARGQELEFRHRTIAEYLAACHVLNTRPKPHWLLEPSWGARWEWPDLGMKVFLAALLVKDGKDIRRQLRHLMWLPFRKEHIGFIAALVRHGVDLDEKVLALAVRRLSRAIRSPSTGDEWQRTVQWLHEIDADATTAVLRQMAEEPGKLSANRRFEAVRYLITMNAPENVNAVTSYLKSPDVRPIERSSVNKLLAEVDEKLSAEVFAKVAFEAPGAEQRLQGIEFVLHYDVGQGLQLAAGFARHTSNSDALRTRSMNLASGHDEALGFVLWSEFMVTARLPESRAQAMELLYERDPVETARQLETARKNRENPPGHRHEFAEFLVRRAGKPEKLLLETAEHHAVPAEQRVHAALLNKTTDPVGAAAIIKDVIRRRKPDDPALMKNIGHLQSISKPDAVDVLCEVAKDRHENDDLRMAVAEQVAAQAALDLHEHLAGDRTLSDANRVVAARRLMRLGQSRGVAALVMIALDGNVSSAQRMEAAKHAKAQSDEAGYRAYESIAEDRHVKAVNRVEAAVQAKKANASKGARLLQGLAREKLDGEAQLALASAVDKMSAKRILHQLAASSIATKHRFAAAKRLRSVAGSKEAAIAYKAIAESKTVNYSQQIEAQKEADRLGGV